jgi:hypothetical protein
MSFMNLNTIVCDNSFYFFCITLYLLLVFVMKNDCVTVSCSRYHILHSSSHFYSLHFIAGSFIFFSLSYTTEPSWHEWFLLHCPAGDVRFKYMQLVLKTIQSTLVNDSMEAGFAAGDKFLSTVLVPLSQVNRVCTLMCRSVKRLFCACERCGPFFSSPSVHVPS